MIQKTPLTPRQREGIQHRLEAGQVVLVPVGWMDHYRNLNKEQGFDLVVHELLVVRVQSQS